MAKGKVFQRYPAGGTRNFNGKPYKYVGFHYTKRAADAQAINRRNLGYKVRILENKQSNNRQLCWEIYERK